MTLTQQGLHLEKEEGNEESEGKGVSGSAPWGPLLPFGTPQSPCHRGTLLQPPCVHQSHGDCQAHLCPCEQMSGGSF